MSDCSESEEQNGGNHPSVFYESNFDEIICYAAHQHNLGLVCFPGDLDCASDARLHAPIHGQHCLHPD
jgi:hypothetical protein